MTWLLIFEVIVLDMEINAQITKEEYKEVIRNYFINKDWTKYIAVLALIALALALLSVYFYGWRVLYGFFDAYFFIIFLLFFLIPYGILYIQMRVNIKRIVKLDENWFFGINERGIYTSNTQATHSYPWHEIIKIRKMDDHVVIKPASGNLLCLPVKFLDDQDAASLLIIT